MTTDTSTPQEATPGDSPKMVDGAADALEEVAYRWHLFAHARNPLDAAEALGQLSNAMADMITWHPGYDADTGTLPWEREDAEELEDDTTEEPSSGA